MLVIIRFTVTWFYLDYSGFFLRFIFNKKMVNLDRAGRCIITRKWADRFDLGAINFNII